MKERLVIKNFGPIKSIDIELGKMTILIGEQATGKSTIAKVLSVCKYFSFIVDYNILGKTEDPFYKGLRYWEIDGFYSKDSFIKYENDDYSLTVEEGVIDLGYDNEQNLEYVIKGCSSKLAPKSDRFKLLLKELEESKPFDKKYPGFISDDWYNWTPSENFFRLNVKKVMDNPFFIPTERGLQSLFTLGKNISNLSDSLVEQLTQLNRIVRGFQVDVNINSLSLKYRNENGIGYIKKDSEPDFHTLYNGASGYKSVIPIEISIYFYSKLEKRKRTFIIEEPEMNLFPKAQKKLMEFFVENINTSGHSFLLPTHSPYILTALDNLMYAYKIGNLANGKYREKVSEIIPEYYWINQNDVNVYYLDGNRAIDLVDRESALIDKDFIDNVSVIINEQYDQLLQIEVEHENPNL